MKRVKNFVKGAIIMGATVLLLSNPVLASSYEDINLQIMKKEVRRGETPLSYYEELEKEVLQIKEKDIRRSLELKLDAIMYKHKNKIVSNGEKDTTIDKPSSNEENNTSIETNEKPSNKPSYKGHDPLIEGFGDGSLGLNKAITREEAATIIYRANPQKKVNNHKNFSDTEGRWSEKYIKNINASGYLTGGPTAFKYKFNPTKKITRAEALALVDKNFNLERNKNKVKFNDIKGHWAENLIKETDIFEGYNNKFRPNDYITRAEFIKIINLSSRNNCTLNEDFKEEKEKYKKYYKKEINKAKWAEEYVLEALIRH